MNTLGWQIIFIAVVLIIAIIYRLLLLKKDLQIAKRKEKKLEALNSTLQSSLEEITLNMEQKKSHLFQQSKMATMGEMMENIAHQWRQPLSQINSAVLLIDDSLYEKKL